MTQHAHYHKDVSHLKTIDVYRVLQLFNVTHPALQHAAKKILCAGQRGTKDYERDLREAVDSINRALQMVAEDCNKAWPNAREIKAGGFAFRWPGKPEECGWIEWEGGVCPVPGDTEVFFRVEGGILIGHCLARHWHWHRTGDKSRDIIAYRIAGAK